MYVACFPANSRPFCDGRGLRAHPTKARANVIQPILLLRTCKGRLVACTDLLDPLNFFLTELSGRASAAFVM